MSKRVAVGVAVATLLMVVCVASVFATDWNEYMNYDEPQDVPFDNVVDEDGNIDESSLNYNLFEKYGPVILILSVLMFGAMIGGVCIAREEGEQNDSN